MNNRRDQVARDIAALIDRLGEDKANRLLTLLVQAESAMDAEPTEAEAWQALVAFQNAACDAGYQAGVQGLSHWAELPDAVIGPLEHHLRTTYQTIHDAAIAAYESSVVFECDECGGRGKIVGQYDQDDALAAMQAEPTEAEIDAARQAYWNERRALSNTGLDTWTGDDSAWAAALIAARKAGRE